MKQNLEVQDVRISGHRQPITLRSYRPTVRPHLLPIVIYMHGGGFTGGGLDEAEQLACQVASEIPAWVVSVGYSLAPEFPFPAALEDGYLALAWAANNALSYHADSRRIAVAGYDAGGNIATGMAAVARDRGEYAFAAQALIAPLLDPSLTRVGDRAGVQASDLGMEECARCYSAYLPTVAQRIHPYAALIESSRLAGLPPTLIASAERDLVLAEGEKYAEKLNAAGVHAEAHRYSNVNHRELISHPAALIHVIAFLRRRLFA